jgi:hypothetical protein
MWQEFIGCVGNQRWGSNISTNSDNAGADTLDLLAALTG